MPKITRP